MCGKCLYSTWGHKDATTNRCTVLFWRPACFSTQCAEIFVRQVCLSAVPNPEADSCNAPPSCVRYVTGHGQGRVACWTRYGVQWRLLKLLGTTYRLVSYTEICWTLIYLPMASTETAGHNIPFSVVYWNCWTRCTVQWRLLKLLDTDILSSGVYWNCWTRHTV